MPNHRPLRLVAEPGLSYAPHYAADRLGMFEAHGVELSTHFGAGPHGSWLGEILAAGEADVARGGIWIPLAYRNRICNFTMFAAVCHRNPRVLLSRVSSPFDMEDLVGKTVLLAAAASSQWLFLEGLLLERGIEPQRVRFVRDLDARAMTRLWASGLGDYYLVASPLADELVRAGSAVAATLAALGGAVPWSVYYAKRDFVHANREVLSAMCRALVEGEEWVLARDPSEIASSIRSDFSGWDVEDLTTAVARLQADNVWTPSVAIDQPAFERYERMVAQYGFADTVGAFQDCVDPSIAASVSGGKEV